MPDTKLQPQDIYAYGFDRQLYRYVRKDMDPGVQTLYNPQIVDGNLINSGLSGSGGDMTGSLITTDATPGTFKIIKLTEQSSVYLLAKISAISINGNKYAGFVRGVTYKMTGGTTSIIGQIQDMHTQRDESVWDVDYITTGTDIYLRVWGKAGQTIYWAFFITIVVY